MIETDTRYRDIENVLNIKPAKKSMKYKILFGIVVVSLLAGVSAALYFFVFKDSAGNESSSLKPLEKETKNKETVDEKTQTEEGKIETIVGNNELIMKNLKLGERLQGDEKSNLNSTEKENTEGKIEKDSKEEEGTTDDDSINEKDQKQINGFDQGNQGVVLEIVVELNNTAQGEQQQVEILIIPVEQDYDEEVPKDDESNDGNQNQKQQQQIDQDEEKLQEQSEEIKERDKEIQDIIDNFSAFFEQSLAWIIDMMN